MQELEHTHARAAEIIHRIPSDTSDEDVFDLTRWEPLGHIYKRKLLVLMAMYKGKHGLIVESISSLFNHNYNTTYNSRNSSAFILPRFTLDMGRTSLWYRGPIAWNSLPGTLKQAPSVNNFKCLLKQKNYKHILNNPSFLKEAYIISNKSADFKYY